MADKNEEVESMQEDEEDEAGSAGDGDEAGSAEEESSGEEIDEAELRAKYGPGLVVTREKRTNAGKRMNALLDDEANDDDFYKTAYGDEIFREDSSEYHSSEDDSEDEFDSDFTTEEEEDEGAEAVAAAAAEAEVVVKEKKEGKKRKNLYVDPLAKKAKRGGPGAGRNVLKQLATSHGFVEKPTVLQASGEQRKSQRAHAVDHRQKIKEREEASSKRRATTKPRVQAPEKKITFQERLAEAAVTERRNLESLSKYQLMEAEKKKTTLRKTAYTGHIITYLSTTRTAADGTRECRNYLTFSDSNHLIRRYFPGANLKPAAAQPTPAAPAAVAPAPSGPTPAGAALTAALVQQDIHVVVPA
eukprot:m.241642 g.241642  ORF g.241642 m.241642 type:complete len:359 (+) comp13886_c0_seq1:21-1097(+)